MNDKHFFIVFFCVSTHFSYTAEHKADIELKYSSHAQTTHTQASKKYCSPQKKYSCSLLRSRRFWFGCGIFTLLAGSIGGLCAFLANPCLQPQEVIPAGSCIALYGDQCHCPFPWRKYQTIAQLYPPCNEDLTAQEIIDMVQVRKGDGWNQCYNVCVTKRLSSYPVRNLNPYIQECEDTRTVWKKDDIRQSLAHWNECN